MNRVQIFQKCKPKMPELENYVSGGNKEYKIDVASNVNVPLSYFIGRGEGGVFGSMKDGTVAALINVQERHDAHAVVFVKSKFLKHGWALFDPNGSKNLPFKIIDRSGKNVTDEYIQPNITNSINYGSESINPGYCGTYGLIFMIFLRFHINNSNWVEEWISVLKKFSIKSGKTNKGIEFSAEVQKLIGSASNMDTVTNQIYQSLVSFMRDDTTVQFGKQKYNYNNRMYNVNVGPRGGRYILLKGLKKYI